MNHQLDYFYCPQEHIAGNTVVIQGEEFSHLVHVMRKREGDEIRVVDGRGTAYDVRIEHVKHRTAQGSIHQTYVRHHESPFNVTLAAGVLKNPSKFDFLVEKVTELGVRQIIPLLTERTIPNHAKVDRWQKIALAAMKQSCRSYLPLVGGLTSIDDIVRDKKFYDLRLIAHEKIKSGFSLDSIQMTAQSSVLILIGPEGGFSDEEIRMCETAAFSSISLGERRLRTETAAIVVAAFILR